MSEGMYGDMATDNMGPIVTYFLKYNGETKKVVGAPWSYEALLQMFTEKYGEAAIGADPSNTSFHMEDKQYHVNHKIEDFTEIYDGAVIEAKYEKASDMKKELEDMKRKLQSLEDTASKRRNVYRTSEGKAAPADDGHHIVRIRGLPWSATAQDVMQFFKGLRIVDDSILFNVNIMGKATGEAFMQFASEEDARGAVARNNAMLGHRYIEVYNSSLAERQKAEHRIKQAKESGRGDRAPVPFNSSSSVLRIRGLPYAATEDDIKNFFSGLEIVGVHLIADHLGRPSGEAYIEFPNEDMSRRGLAMDRKTMGSRYIEVFASNHTDLSSALRGYPRPSQGNRGGRGAGGFPQTGFVPGAFGGFVAPAPMMAAPRGRPFNAMHGRGMARSTAPGETPYIRMLGLPFGATENEITRFFQEAGVMPVRIHRKQTGGVAFVEFNTPQEARVALTRDRAYIGTRYIELFPVDYDEMAATVGLPSQAPAAFPRAPIQTRAYAGYPGAFSGSYGSAAGAYDASQYASNTSFQGYENGAMGNPYPQASAYPTAPYTGSYSYTPQARY